jgi:hypothetical protein
MIKIKLDNYEFKKSSKKNKKYDVFKNKKFIVSFGDKRYQQYNDKIGLFKNLNHNDEKRKNNYYSRFGKDAKNETAKYFSHKYLW